MNNSRESLGRVFGEKKPKESSIQKDFSNSNTNTLLFATFARLLSQKVIL